MSMGDKKRKKIVDWRKGKIKKKKWMKKRFLLTVTKEKNKK